MTDTTFNATGSDQFFIVPVGVPYLSVVLGGSASGFATGIHGTIRRISVVIPVTPGETLNIRVGVKPSADATTSGGRLGGWPDGGDGGTDLYSRQGLGGGGSSSIWRGATLLAIAGGGGGLASRTALIISKGNGAADGLIGADGISPNVTSGDQAGGGGGTQSAGGAAGPNLGSTNAAAGNAGSYLQGGAGATTAFTSVLAGSGGGGGYYGGGGGSSRHQPIDGSGNSYGSAGGGGSSWADPALSSLTVDSTSYTTEGIAIVSYTVISSGSAGGWGMG